MNFEYLIYAKFKNNNKKKIKEDADWSKPNKLAMRPAIKAGTNSSPYYSFRRHRGEQFSSRSGWPSSNSSNSRRRMPWRTGDSERPEGPMGREWSDGPKRRDADGPEGRR